MNDGKKVRARHALFIAELMKDPQRMAGPAYARAYKVADNAAAHASARRIITRPEVAAEVARLEEVERERRGITAEDVVREITIIAKADPRGLFEVYRGACRYCHGVGHLYHQTPREYREAWRNYQIITRGEDPHGLKFDHQGGVGFNQRARPHPDCPECFGLGEAYEVIKDSRDWAPGAARLFSGLQRTKEGLKITTRSQDAALKLAAQMHSLLTPEKDDPENDLPPPTTIVYGAKDARKKGRTE